MAPLFDARRRTGLIRQQKAKHGVAGLAEHVDPDIVPICDGFGDGQSQAA